MFTARSTAVLVSAAGPTTYNQEVTATCGTTATITKLVNFVVTATSGLVATLVAGITGVSAVTASATVAVAPVASTFQKQINKILTAEA